MRKVLALGWGFALAGAALASEKVDVSLHCLSVKMKPAQYKHPLTGLIWEAEIGSVDEVPLNQELMIMPPEVPFSHGGWIRLTNSNLLESTWIPLTINIPAFEDENGNGLHDFFEVSQAVGPISTTGVVAPVDGDEGEVEARWIREADARKGTCELTLTSLGLSFRHEFELIEFEGWLDYDREDATNLTGAVDIKQFQAETNRLLGPLAGSVLGRDALYVAPGVWTNTAGTNFHYDVFEPLERLNDYYSGYFSFVDGDATTETLDYIDWVLLVTDSRDVDGDGVPDLTDLPDPPLMNLRVEDGQLVFQVSGMSGGSYQFESATNLEVGDWEKAFAVTLTTATQDFKAPLPEGETIFWRVRID
ncbi:MAG: hypothetical protein ACYDC1_15390 [Limisphaerales bacterium]